MARLEMFSFFPFGWTNCHTKMGDVFYTYLVVYPNLTSSVFRVQRRLNFLLYCLHCTYVETEVQRAYVTC